MKKKEFEALKKKSTKELKKEASELRKKIKLSYMKIRVGQEKNLKTVKNLRRDLAQIISVLAQGSYEPEKETK